MTDSGEQQSLLQKDVFVHINPDMYTSGRSYNYKKLFRRTNENTYLHEDNWPDSDSSSCSSYYSDCHSSSVAEWESEITADGQLFYIESYSQPKHNQKQDKSESHSEKNEGVLTSNKDSKTKTTAKGKLVHLIRRRSGSRRSTRKKLNDNTNREEEVANRGSGSKVTFRESQEGESREVTLKISPESSSLGRRATIAESLLGLVLSTFSDKNRVMVAGFIPNSQASKKRNIKIGDWLKDINGQEVTYETINTVINQIKPPCEVTLKLQRVAECDITQPASSQSFKDKVSIEQSELVREIVYGCKSTDKDAEAMFCVLYTSQEGVTESGPSDQGLVYRYPNQDKLFSSARGAFVTINHLLPDLIKTTPISSTTKINNQLYHLIHTCESNEMFFLAVPNSRCSLEEAILLNSDIKRALNFTYQNLSKCFTNKENHCELDRLFSLLHAQFLVASTITLDRFEDRLTAAHYMALPRDAQVQIDDALSELESNDFGGYNDDDNCQRLYSIIGSCLFYKGYLLTSHLSREDLVDVNAFCRHNGLLSLSRAESVKSIVVWKEVFPASCNRGLPSHSFFPKGRWFLVLVGQEESLLAVLLESGGCTVEIEGNPGPEPIYIKQAQATLQHIKEIEVISLAEKWISNQCRLHVVSPDNDFKTSARASTDTNNSADFSNKSTTPSPGSTKKPQEVTSILKHASTPEEGYLNSGQYDTSEDSTSQAASSVISDEAAPILGRRAEREQATDSRLSCSDSDFSSDSDWTSFKDSFQDGFSNRFFDLSDLGRTLLSDIEYTPMRLTAGEKNTLFCYVHFDSTEGIVLCSPSETSPGRMKFILDNFRLITPMIHSSLQNTVRFKKLKVQEVSECLINKTLIANKEQAMLFECPPSKNENSKKSPPLTYWIVGRLFFVPQPREVYICYQDSSPQNLVEVAFRLALSSSG